MIERKERKRLFLEDLKSLLEKHNAEIYGIDNGFVADGIEFELNPIFDEDDNCTHASTEFEILGDTIADKVDLMLFELTKESENDG